MKILHRTAVIVALTGLLAGCSGLPGGGDGAESDGSGSGSGSAVKAGEPGVDSAGKPVVGGTFDTSVAEGAKIEIAVMGLKARGRLATLTMRLTPRLPAAAPDQTPNPYELNGRHGLGTSLIDPVNLKRYVVVKDSSGKELESDDIFVHTRNNQPSNYTYTFAAPPENVKAVDVQYGSWPMFRNIPVER
ncbi:hypothetical protein [Actinomadura sp. 9N407]|uniref:hypothetical protein n=1 Tax=Actinomadura sp. 9N407 TaxID=3375154 RepID=UPI0037B240C6